ncbi:MAG: DUF4411 family protein [Limnochordia bacterium]
MDKQYALDADVLISASRGFYAFDIAPAFWRQLAVNGKDRLILVDRVCQVIYAAEDQLSEWLKTNEGAFTIKSSQDDKVIETYSRIMAAVEVNPVYYGSAKAAFAGTAESWLCAHALAHGHVVVTQERYEPQSRNEVTIPNICREFSIEYVNLFQLMRLLGIRFET